jgi:hypothetical protein
MSNAKDLIERGRMFDERADRARDPISRLHYREMATTDRYRLNIRKRKPLGANWSTGTRASDGRAPASAVPNSSLPDRD